MIKKVSICNHMMLVFQIQCWIFVPLVESLFKLQVET